MTVNSQLHLCSGTFVFVPSWSGVEKKCTVHVALTKSTGLNWIHKSRKHALKAYCPNMYILRRQA